MCIRDSSTLCVVACAATQPWAVEFTVNLSPGEQGNFVVEVHPEWAPNAAARFKELLDSDFFKGNRFFRVIPGQIAQFGINGNPEVSAIWKEKFIEDDVADAAPQNYKGAISFSGKVSKAGPKYGPLTGSDDLSSERLHFLAAAKIEGEGTRTTQMFINLKDNLKLLDTGAVPFARVVSGMDVVERLYNGYGETSVGRGDGTGPDQLKIISDGNKYLKSEFGKLSYVVSTQAIKRREDL
eukprot:TRINITY_DN10362_c0_g1_i6.p1 TRINITY_DN10362_c0_g1~~TRINITY_DN10362_c0_g1_i6.p1  ORF type:complete len:239 (+),score=50.25 TRINITY_DN10362_c0_g1_i6:53-769(+)